MDTARRSRPTFIEQARRRQIIDATIVVLAADGYRAATFARVARQVDISPSLISYHFATKTTLMSDVVTHIIADMDTTITSEIGDTDSARVALRALIESQVRYFAEHTDAVLALGHIGNSGDGAITAQLDRHRTASIAELEELFTAGQQAGEMTTFPTRPMAVTLMAALEAVPTEFRVSLGTDTTAYGTALADLFDAATRHADSQA